MSTLHRAGLLRLAGFLCACLLAGAPAAAPDTSLTIAYQGYLADLKGQPIDGSRHFIFTLHSDATGGEALWNETHESVPVAKGVFSVMLGSIQSLEVPTFDNARWLGIRVSGEEFEMAPRQRLGSAPFAFIAQRANALSGNATILGSQITGAITGATLSGGTLNQLQGQLQSQFIPVLQPAISANSIHVVDASGSAGEWSSMTIGADGFPLIAYKGPEGLWFAKCGNAACSAGNTLTLLDSPGGDSASMATGADGWPVIAHMSSAVFGSTNVRLVKCGNTTCSARTAVTVDTVPIRFMDDHRHGVSVAIGSSGFPLIAYSDEMTSGKVLVSTLRLASCGNASCSSGNSINVLESFDGGRSSIAIGRDGMPWVAYGFNRVLRCVTADCSGTGNFPYTAGGPYMSMAMGADGLPIVSHMGTPGGGVPGSFLSATKCTNAGCALPSVVDAAEAPPGVATDAGYFSSIAIGADGLPVIAQHDWLNQSLRVAKCGNYACSAGNIANVVDSNGVVGWEPSVAIGADGFPVMSYYDVNNGHLKVLKCGNAFCAPSFQRR